MAVTLKLYSHAPYAFVNKEADWDTDSIKVMLCTSAYTPDQNAHAYKSDITNEVTGTGYSAGGAALPSPSRAVAGAVTTLSGSSVSWAASTITARYAVIYDATPGSDATRPVIGYVDFGADVSTTSGTFTINWNASGIFTFTVS